MTINTLNTISNITNGLSLVCSGIALGSLIGAFVAEHNEDYGTAEDLVNVGYGALTAASGLLVVSLTSEVIMARRLNYKLSKTIVDNNLTVEI